MNQQIIRDFYGNIKARIEIKPNGDKILRDFGGNIKGRYDSACNVTRDFFGRIVGRGDCLSMLIGT